MNYRPLLLGIITFQWICGVITAEDYNGSGQAMLYGTTYPPVREYTGSSNAFWEDTATARVVEFYSPTCPVCVEFQPEYISLARSTTEKYDSVRFYAVSCDHHVEVCQKYGVEGFPSLFAFPVDGSGTLLEEEGGSGFSADKIAKILNLDRKQMGKLTEWNTDVVRRRLEDSQDFEEEYNSEDVSGETQADEEEQNSYAADSEEELSPDVEEEDGSVKEDGSEEEEESDEEEIRSAEEANESADDSAENDDKEESGEIDNYSEHTNTETPEDSLDQRDDTEESGEEGSPKGYPETSLGEEEEEIPEFHPERLDGASEEESESEEERATVFYPPLPPPPPETGASFARQYINDMDRFHQQMKAQRDAYHGGRFNFGAPGNPVSFAQVDPSTMSAAMRLNTPGTAEFKKRQEQFRARLAKDTKRLRKKDPPSVTYNKRTLPYRKDVSAPRFREKIPVVKKAFKMSSEEALILDTSRALMLALENGTYLSSSKALSFQQRKALKGFLDLLSLSLPPEWGIHRMIDDLRDNFAFIATSNENLRSILGKHRMPRAHFSLSCPGKSGFTCGFWKLLHVATVGIAAQQGGQNLIEAGMIEPTTMVFSPITAADAIRDYIELFFTCKECKDHFIKQYDDCDNNRRCVRLTGHEKGTITTADWKELAVWLWEVHNEVSIRLVKQKNDKARGGSGKQKIIPEISALWPNIETCFLCFNEDGTWNEEQVFRHLEKDYWPDSDLDPMADKLLRLEGVNQNTSSLLLWLVVLLVVSCFYKVVGSQSGSIHDSLYKARHLAAQSALMATSQGRQDLNHKKF